MDPKTHMQARDELMRGLAALPTHALIARLLDVSAERDALAARVGVLTEALRKVNDKASHASASLSGVARLGLYHDALIDIEAVASVALAVDETRSALAEPSAAPVEAAPARRHLPADEEVRLHFAKPVEAASEAPDWLHLKRYGYAPGHYMNTCRKCRQQCVDLDKRAICCRPCAEKLHDASEAPAEPYRMSLGEQDSMRRALHKSVRFLDEAPAESAPPAAKPGDAYPDRQTARTYSQDELDAAVDAERERCAKAAEDYLTRGRSPLGRAVADTIRRT